MKISKLFHWLYAFLMFLPVLAVGGTCLYAIFNVNAKDSYYGETINDMSLIELSSNSELSSDKSYYFYGRNAYDTTYSGTIQFLNCEYVSGWSTITSEQIDFINSAVRLYYYRGTSVTLYDSEQNSLVIDIDSVLKINNLIVEGTSNNTFRMLKEIQYNSDSFVSNAFYYSVDYIKESYLFGWADDTFLVTPFTYIGSFLGLPSNSAIYLFLGYWLSISLAWLVFDLIMYVPLLVHRWIDKGVLE